MLGEYTAEEMQEAIRPHALALGEYSPRQLEIRQKLMEEGLRLILGRAQGGRVRGPVCRAAIRLMLIEMLYADLPPECGAKPTSTATVHKLCDLLAERYGSEMEISPERMVKDIKKIGAKRLRELSLGRQLAGGQDQGSWAE